MIVRIVSVNMFPLGFVKLLYLRCVVMGRRPYRESKATLLPNIGEPNFTIGNHPRERD